MKTCDICKKEAPGCVPYLICEDCSSLAYAAPDLLEACRLAATFHHDNTNGKACNKNHLCIFCKAISKAEGEK